VNELVCQAKAACASLTRPTHPQRSRPQIAALRTEGCDQFFREKASGKNIN